MKILALLASHCHSIISIKFTADQKRRNSKFTNPTKTNIIKINKDFPKQNENVTLQSICLN